MMDHACPPTLYYRRFLDEGTHVYRFDGQRNIYLHRHDDRACVFDFRFRHRDGRPPLAYTGARWQGQTQIVLLPNPDHLGRAFFFADRWVNIVQVFELSGRSLAYKCDICTPAQWCETAYYQTDLWLDLLVTGDGLGYVISDEDEFAQAEAAGLMTPDIARQAQETLAWLVERVESEQFLAWLADLCPAAVVAVEHPRSEVSVAIRWPARIDAGVRPWQKQENCP